MQNAKILVQEIINRQRNALYKIFNFRYITVIFNFPFISTIEYNIF